MAISWSQVPAAFPNDAALAAVGSEGETYVTWAEEQVSDAVLGTRADQVRILISAHIATLMGGSGGLGASGPVSSESVDGVSRSYATATPISGTDLEATGYGRRALMLIQASPRARMPRAY